MMIRILFCCALFLFACGPNSTRNAGNKKQVTDYVLRSEVLVPFSEDTVAALAKTIGKPIDFSGEFIRFVYEGTVYTLPNDSALAKIDKPSFFRNPEEKLSSFREGEAPEVFAFDLYDPYPDTWVDSVSLVSYKLEYDYVDMTSVYEGDKLFGHLDQGTVKLVFSNQSKGEVVAVELEAEMKKRLKSGAACVVEPFKRSLQVDLSVPSLSQLRINAKSDSLSADLICMRSQYFEAPYEAVFTLLRYQLKGDSSWVDARKREIISE